MKHLIHIVFLIMLSSLVSAEISDEGVVSLLARMAEASNEKNIKKIESMLSQDFQVEMIFDTPNGKRILKNQRNEYLTSMKQAFSQAETYEYSYELKEIQLNLEDRSARAIVLAKQSVSVKGRIFNEKAVEEYSIVTEGNELKFEKAKVSISK